MRFDARGSLEQSNWSTNAKTRAFLCALTREAPWNATYEEDGSDAAGRFYAL